MNGFLDVNSITMMSFRSDDNIVLSSTGKAEKAQGQSSSTFLTSLATSVLLCCFVMVVKFGFKPKFINTYRSGTYLSAALKRQTEASWPRMIFFPMPDPITNDVSGLENYFFDRYLHTILRLFILLTLTILPFLLPLTYLGGRNAAGGVIGLDQFGFTNISLSNTDRYWAHLAAAIFVAVIVVLTLQFELQSYARFQEIVITTQVEGSTILVVSSSSKRLTFESLQNHFRGFSGGISSIKINRDYRKLHEKIQQRALLISNLETAETALIRSAQRSKHKFSQSLQSKGIRQLWKRYVPLKDRPSMRLPLWDVIPLLGAKVDAIYHCRAKIVRYSQEIERDQKDPTRFPLLNSAFVRFNYHLSIPLPLLALKAQVPVSWTIRRGVVDSDIIWSNVSISWWEQFARIAIVLALLLTLILGFGLPTTLTGSLSQVSYLANVIPGLSSINKIPSWALGIIQGVLPPTILATFTAFVPTILRILTGLQGIYSRHALETTIQTYYFIFLFIQVFFIVSLSASIATVVEELGNKVGSVPALLAQNLPKASNYFLSYLIINTATTITSTLLLPTELLNIMVSPILDKNARQKWTRREDLRLKMWGTFLPVYTNLACIGLIYSVIAPLILPGSGQFYPVAIHQLFTGLYIMELSLVGLFFLVRDSDGKAACTWQAIIMIFITMCTVLFHCLMDYGHRLSWRTLFVSYRHWKGKKDVPREVRMSRRKIPDTAVNIDHEKVPAGDVIWIPEDELGVAVNEIYHTSNFSHRLVASRKGAHLAKDGSIILRSGPPDLRYA